MKHDEGIELRERVNENPTDRFVGEKNKRFSDDGHATVFTVAQRNHDLRNRMGQSRTYGSVGARGEQSARATRPTARKVMAWMLLESALPRMGHGVRQV